MEGRAPQARKAVLEIRELQAPQDAGAFRERPVRLERLAQWVTVVTQVRRDPPALQAGRAILALQV